MYNTMDTATRARVEAELEDRAGVFAGVLRNLFRLRDYRPCDAEHPGPYLTAGGRI